MEGGVTDEKGGVQEKGGSGPPDPPSGYAYGLEVKVRLL